MHMTRAAARGADGHALIALDESSPDLLGSSQATVVDARHDVGRHEDGPGSGGGSVEELLKRP